MPETTESNNPEEQAASAPCPREETGWNPNWDQLLPSARKRLAHRLKGSSELPNAEVKQNESQRPPFGATPQRIGSLPEQLKLLPSQAKTSDPARKDEPKAAEKGNKPREKKSTLEPILAALGPEVSRADEVLAKGRNRGVIASIVVHAVLLLILGLVTFELPSQSAGMSFAASSDEPEQEILELEQPLDLPEPSEMTESQQVPAELQATEQFENITASPLTPEAIGDMAAVASPSLSSASAIRSAASAAAASEAKFFGASAGGNNFCYVVDGSGSMKGGPWIAARGELLKSLASLKPKQRFYIIIFSRSLQLLPDPGTRQDAQSALYATPENLAHARSWLMGVKIGNSGAAPKKAIEAAIEKEPDAIYLLTDGVTTVKDVAATILEANTTDDLLYGKQIRVPIHTIAYYSLKGQDLLREIASQNKGQFIYIPDPNP